MSEVNKQELRRLANSAYRPERCPWERRGWDVHDPLNEKPIARCDWQVDSAFIAAADPGTVLALLDELSRLELKLAGAEFVQSNSASLIADLKDERSFLARIEQVVRETVRDSLIQVTKEGGANG